MCRKDSACFDGGMSEPVKLAQTEREDPPSVQVEFSVHKINISLSIYSNIILVEMPILGVTCVTK